MFLCKQLNAIVNKKKFNTSILSQFHQVPQVNSCSAHQEPNMIEIRDSLYNKRVYLI